MDEHTLDLWRRAAAHAVRGGETEALIAADSLGEMLRVWKRYRQRWRFDRTAAIQLRKALQEGDTIRRLMDL